MSLEDPFYTVRNDVRESLEQAHQLYAQWKLHLDGHTDLEKFQSATTDLRSCIKSIDWDLQDLEETITIAEAHPHKFRLSLSEIDTRKKFIHDTKQVVMRMKSHMNSDVAQGVLETLKRQQLLNSAAQRKSHSRYQKLEEEMERSNQDFIDQQRHQQQVILARQDKQAEKVGETIGVLHQMGHDIGIELDEQNQLIEELEEDMERTDTRLVALTKRVNKAIRKSSDRCQIICIIILVVVLVLIIVMFFIPFS